MKRWTVVLLACLLTCTAGCGSDDDTGGSSTTDAAHQEDSGAQPDVDDGDSGLDAGDVGSDADASAPGYPDDIAYEDFRQALVDEQVALICAVGWRCESVMVNDASVARRFESEEACRSGLKDSAFLLAPYEEETRAQTRLIEAGRVIYDSEKAAACLNTIPELVSDEVCTTAAFAEFTACNESEILTGTIGDGGRCIDRLECASERTYCRSTGDSCEGTCETYENTCGDSVCAEDQYCKRDPDAGTQSCESRKTEGAQCASSTECGQDLSCMRLDGESSGICLGRGSRQRGQSCGSHFYCEGTDVCVDETCQAFEFAEQGDACSYEEFCEPGTICQLPATDAVVGSCQPPADVGERCMYTGDCAFELYCDRPSAGQMGSCARLKPDDASCDRNEQCQAGLCISDTCGGEQQFCPVPS